MSPSNADGLPIGVMTFSACGQSPLGADARSRYRIRAGRSAAIPAREVIKLLDDVALNFLVGNHDAHGKNFSRLYPPGSGHAVLAPAYDVLSTFAYRKTRNLTRMMAMSIGGEYHPEHVRARHLDRLFDEAGLGAAAARRRLRGIARTRPAQPETRASS